LSVRLVCQKKTTKLLQVDGGRLPIRRPYAWVLLGESWTASAVLVMSSIDDAYAELESLLNIEQKFYDEGFEDGLKHGKELGLIEGRTIGKGKGFEMWEELGFYEGFALMWQAVYTSQNRDTERAAHHIRHLLDLIKQFPQVNPPESSDLDIPKMFLQVRSRYKALCSTLGVKPSLRAAQGENVL